MRRLAIIVGVVGLMATGAATAQASAPTIEPGRTVHLDQGGTEVDWHVRITCPALESYTITAILDDLSTDAPYYDGGDRGVRAVVDAGEVTGTCTGHVQVVRFTAQVTAGPDGTSWPMSRGGRVNTFVSLSTASTDAFACQHVACASTTHDWKPRLR